MAAASVTEYGDPVADREMLGAISPMTAVERLTAPVLLVFYSRTRMPESGQLADDLETVVG